jgi:hypothetical protein
MLTAAGTIPDNSTTPHPASYWEMLGGGDLYSDFAAGLSSGPSACLPNFQSFIELSPAGSVIPMAAPNASQPALSSAVLGPSPVSPLASQVAHTSQALLQNLTSVGRSAEPLALAVDAQGQQGAQLSPADFPNAPVVVPIGSTANQIVEQQTAPSVPVGPSGAHLAPAGWTQPVKINRPQVSRWRSYKSVPRDPQFPGAPWGGAAASIPGGGCSRGIAGLSLAQMLFLAAGLGIITVAVLDNGK